MRHPITFWMLILSCQLSCQPMNRGIDVPPSVITGTVRNDIQEPVPFALVARDGVPGQRASPEAGFRLLVQSGVTVVHASQDIDNDGTIDLATVRRVNVPAYNDRAAFVLLGDVSLEGTFAITGRVVDDQATPVVGARIVAVRRTSDINELTTTGIAIDANNDPLTAVEASATTDNDGNYRLTGLARGVVQLMATTESGASTLVELEVVPPAVSAPDVVIAAAPDPVDVSVLIVPSVEAVSLSVYRAGEIDVADAVPVLANINATQLSLAPGLYDVAIDAGENGRARLLNQVVPSGEPAVLWSYALLGPVLPPFAGECTIPEDSAPIQPAAITARADAVFDGVRCVFPTCDGQPLGVHLDNDDNFDCTVITGDLCLNAVSLGGDNSGSAQEWLESVTSVGRHLSVDGVPDIAMPRLRAIHGALSVTDGNLDVPQLVTASHVVLDNGSYTSAQALLLTGDGPIQYEGNAQLGSDCSSDVGCDWDRCVDELCVIMPMPGEACFNDQCSFGLSCEDNICAPGTIAYMTINNAVTIGTLRIDADFRHGDITIDNSNAQRMEVVATGRVDALHINNNASLQTVVGALPGVLTGLFIDNNSVLTEVGLGDATPCAAVVVATDNSQWCQATDWVTRSASFTSGGFFQEQTLGTGTACEQQCGDTLLQGDEVCDDGGTEGLLDTCNDTCSQSLCGAGGNANVLFLAMLALASRRRSIANVQDALSQ